MSEREPPQRQVGPRGEAGMSAAQKNWVTLLVGCFSGLGAIVAIVGFLGLVLVGLVIFTCGIR